MERSRWSIICEDERTLIVPRAVREAFGLDDDAVALNGGEGGSVLIGDVVLKQVHDVDEAEWVQELQARMAEDGFRVARPVATLAGWWTHAGWSATQFIAGLRPVAPAWQTVAAISLRFSDAAEAACDGHTEALAARTHRWAIADRVAWGEIGLDLGSEAMEVYAQLGALLSVPPTGRQVVHGDLTGNVYVDRRQRSRRRT
jgi:peptidoglycan hydrolase-like protein with peptidoglycan-binding domain